jgi:hypothetical protein
MSSECRHGFPAWRHKHNRPLRDGRVMRWVVGGRRYQTAPKRTLGILTGQLKMTPEDWTQALRSALFGELTGRGHAPRKGERGS